MEYDLDLDLVDEEDAAYAADSLDDKIEDNMAKEQAQTQQLAQAGDASAAPQGQPQQQQPQQKQPEPTQQQQLEERGDSRADDQFQLSDITNEVSSIFTGGVRDTVSSALTLPERVGDMLSGEANEQDYDGPDWDPLGGERNPITTTWWGNFLRGGVHFATMAVGAAVAIKGAAIAGIPGAGIAAAATGTKLAGTGRAAVLAGNAMKGLAGKKLVAAKLAQGATMGAVGDVVSEYSQDDNAMGALVKRFPALDNAFATKDTDSPQMKMFKNVVEGMGIGMVADGVLMLIGKRGGNVAKAVADSDHRNASVEKQTVERGMTAVDSPDFDAYKNAPMSDPQQGAVNSGPKSLDDAMNQRKRYADAQDKSTVSMDSVTTPTQLKRADNFVDMTPAQTKKWYRDIFGNNKFESIVEEIRSQGKNPDEVLRTAYAGFKEMIDPLNDLDISDKEFQKLLTKDVVQEFGEDAVTMLSPEKLVMIDLVNASNTAAIRDRAIAAREIGEVLDVSDVDGPVAVIAERLAFGIEQAKTARAMWSEYGRRIQDPEARAAANKKFAEKKSKIKTETKDAVNAMVQILNRTDSKELTMAALEAFSMAGGPKNQMDLWKYFDRKLKGGELNGKPTTGRLIKELQGVMIHSVLTGPKTPVRAVMGTGIATFTKPFAQAIGAVTKGDAELMKESISTLASMREALPEAFKLFKTRLSAYWSGDLQTNFKKYKVSQDNLEWMQIEAQRKFRKDNGVEWGTGNEIAFQIARLARNANDTSLLTYGTKIMAATDDAFGYVMARAHSRKKAFRAALDNQKGMPEINSKLMKEYEDRFYADLLDEEGNINWDANQALKFEQEEATLTRDLTGWISGFERIAENTPWVKPFFLFTRTGVNGIDMTFKHMPLFNKIVKDERMIENATAEMVEAGQLVEYGISNLKDLEAAKALQRGRQLIGGSLISMASMAYLSGNITGNGPPNRKERKLWMDAGWKPRSIKDPVTGVWVNYDAFEPFGSILSFVADLGDYQNSMGPEFTEKSLAKGMLVMAQGVTQKSYLAGMQQFVDLMSGEPGQIHKMLSNLANNQLPLSSLRNEIGKVVNPYMKELNSGFMESIRNRNQVTEFLAGEEGDLPIKYDILTGKPINNSNFMNRMWNAVSPVQFNLDYSPGRKLLFESKYDIRTTAYSNPDKVDLSDAPEVRSMFQKAIGEQNLDKQLAELAKRPSVKKSLAKMEKDLANGDHKIDPITYPHNELIGALFDKAKKRAWAKIARDPKVAKLIAAQKAADAADINRGRGDYERTDIKFKQSEDLLNMPIK